MAQPILYSTPACHLCELAEGLLLEAARATVPGLVWRVVDISGDDALFERYGERIPVLCFASGAELDWPFTGEELHRALRREGLCQGPG
ncbi:glutaredoxin family protein [Pseudohaliea rubra]|uniref:Thiol-disulfide isomerase and thioredoxin n=1 Tax=Pseudohaliea rubra DSM 19751 TaxID=1265313 RepID=A0A095VRN4_9GAMM|nr:glutaredoxin family protein [Pseudohaliea rubra]KGE03753.1 Thiol-disulfide isomerase and thioredoxin [Pseudohaliea rubra DSM 19751]